MARRRASEPRRANHLRWLSRGTAIPLILVMILAPIPVRADDGSLSRFIVTLEDSVDKPGRVAGEHQDRHGGEIRHIYRHALKGYAAELPEDAASAIARDPRVLSVERDQAVTTAAQTIPTGIRRVDAPANPAIGIDGQDDLRVDADIAIIDTGVDPDHPDLDVVSSVNCLGSGALGDCVEGGRDDNGHGTHVAGTAAAIDDGNGVVGVAPGARIHSVKVLAATGDGLMSDVVGGIDWVTAHADVIEIANMSLGCRCTMASLDLAIAGSVDAGVVHVVAAGNQDQDATGYSPAGHPDVVTVSALADFDGAAGGNAAAACGNDTDDTLADFSNWGEAVDVVAPGTCILSTSTLGRYATMSGTSMASPHVAGAAALLASGANEPRNREDVRAVHDTIVRSGSPEWVDDSGDGLTEPLLDVGDASVFIVNSPDRTLGNPPPPPPPGGNEPPIAAFTYSCSDLSCSFDATGSSDPDGTVSSYAWDLGDGTGASEPVVEKTYGSPGTYEVTLVVTDDSGATAAAKESITVSSPDNGDHGDFQLMGTAAWAAGSLTVTLYWYGTDLAGAVVVYRNGEAIATTADDGSYTDVVNAPSGSYTYRLCEENTTRCSNEARFF